MKVSEFRRFRAEVVGALAAHPEWCKVRRSSYDMAATIVPRAAGARTYWRIRNGTKGLSQKYANFEDAAAVCLGSAYRASVSWSSCGSCPESASAASRLSCATSARLTAHSGVSPPFSVG